jgi:hypothetical protein
MGKVKILNRKDLDKGRREVQKRERYVALKMNVSEGEKIALEAAKNARLVPGVCSPGWLANTEKNVFGVG